MEHCTHDGRAFLKPCPVCALVQVATERDEARALLADSPTAAARQVAAIARELNQIKLVLAACKTAKEEDYERFQRELADARAEMERLRAATAAWAADMKEAARLCGMADDEYPLKAVMRVVRERDEARAEVKRLRDYDTQQWRRGVDEELAKSREMFEPALVKTMRKERDEARAEVERLREENRKLYNNLQGADSGMTVALREVAARQREAAALTAESWGRRQELIAEDKERETIWASAEMHRAEAIMARRIAQAIRGMPLVTEEDK